MQSSEKLSTTWKSVGGVTRGGRKHKQQESSVEVRDRPVTPSQVESATIPISVRQCWNTLEQTLTLSGSAREGLLIFAGRLGQAQGAGSRAG